MANNKSHNKKHVPPILLKGKSTIGWNGQTISKLTQTVKEAVRRLVIKDVMFKKA